MAKPSPLWLCTQVGLCRFASRSSSSATGPGCKAGPGGVTAGRNWWRSWGWKPSGAANVRSSCWFACGTGGFCLSCKRDLLGFSSSSCTRKEKQSTGCRGGSSWDRRVVFKQQCWQKQWKFYDCTSNPMSRRDYSFNVFMPLSRMERLCCLAIWH